MSQNQKNVAKTIKKTFIKLRNTIGFDKITVSRICQEAHVHRSTFYFHFQDKYDLQAKIQADFLQDISQILIGDGQFFRLNEQNQIIIEKDQFNNLLSFLKLHQTQLGYLLDDSVAFNHFTQLLNHKIVATFENAQQDIPHHPLLPIDYLLDIYIGAVSSIIERWFRNDCRDDINTITNYIYYSIHQI